MEVDQLLVATLGLLKAFHASPIVLWLEDHFPLQSYVQWWYLESLKYLFEGWDHCIGQNFHHFMANRSDKYLASKPIYQPFWQNFVVLIQFVSQLGFKPIFVLVFYYSSC